MFNIKKHLKMKSKVYNVMILDKSGSMNSVRESAVAGVNKTIKGISKTQEENPEQQQLFTLVRFCGCELKRVYENCPIGEVRPLGTADYLPCCSTPLYDAIGTTVVDLHEKVKGEEGALVSVTIITDGYENASHQFSGKAVQMLIDMLKEQGWLFAYIGAEHDVESVAYNLHIDNATAFDKTENGMETMFAEQTAWRQEWCVAASACMADDVSEADRRENLKSLNKALFKRFYSKKH